MEFEDSAHMLPQQEMELARSDFDSWRKSNTPKVGIVCALLPEIRARLMQWLPVAQEPQAVSLAMANIGHVRDPDVRAAIYAAYYATDEKQENLLRQLIDVRHSLGLLSSCPSFAHKTLQMNMMRGPEEVGEFLLACGTRYVFITSNGGFKCINIAIVKKRYLNGEM